MPDRKSKTSSSRAIKEQRASLLHEIWLLTGKNDFVREVYSKASLEELKKLVEDIREINRMTPEERMFDRWRSENQTIVDA